MTGLVKKVAAAAGMSTDACRRVAASAYKRYKHFELPKRNGRGMRLVAQPAKEVKNIQRAIIHELAANLPIHEAATAYRKNLSIKDNAVIHVSSRYITKLDFSAFFESIGAEALEKHLNNHFEGITDAEIRFVLNACLWRPDGHQVLCIGAPSSPFFSNTVMYQFDVEVSEMCRKSGVCYSRYSDDLTFSAAEAGILSSVEDSVRKICRSIQYPRLTFNEEKKVTVGRGSSMRVTGLTLANNGAVTVGRDRKRGVRAGVDKFVRGLLTDTEIEKLRGELAFVLSVEPDFRHTLTSTYGDTASLLYGKNFRLK